MYYYELVPGTLVVRVCVCVEHIRIIHTAGYFDSLYSPSNMFSLSTCVSLLSFSRARDHTPCCLPLTTTPTTDLRSTSTSPLAHLRSRRSCFREPRRRSSALRPSTTTVELPPFRERRRRPPFPHTPHSHHHIAPLPAAVLQFHRLSRRCLAQPIGALGGHTRALGACDGSPPTKCVWRARSAAREGRRGPFSHLERLLLAPAPPLKSAQPRASCQKTAIDLRRCLLGRRQQTTPSGDHTVPHTTCAQSHQKDRRSISSVTNPLLSARLARRARPPVLPALRSEAAVARLLTAVRPRYALASRRQIAVYRRSVAVDQARHTRNLVKKRWPWRGEMRGYCAGRCQYDVSI